jgi:hypothetical protein
MYSEVAQDTYPQEVVQDQGPGLPQYQGQDLLGEGIITKISRWQTSETLMPVGQDTLLVSALDSTLT